MNHCRPGWKRWAGFAFMLFLLIPPIVFAFYQIVWGEMLLSDDRNWIIGGLIAFVGVLIYLVYLVLYLGPERIDYDAERIVFHFPKKQPRSYRWEELAEEKILLVRALVGYRFLFPDRKEFVINRTMVGYPALLAMLQQKDIIKPDTFALSGALTNAFKDFFSDNKK